MKAPLFNCLALLGMLAAATSAADPAPAPASYLPDTEKPTAAVLRGSTWVGGRDSVSFSLQQIDTRQRQAFIEHVSGHAIDPFAAPRGEAEHYITYVLEIRNGAEQTLSFNPKSAWLIPNKKKELRSPFGLTDLRADFRSTDREMPVAYEQVAPALFEHPVTVQPGGSSAGLLIYRALPPNIKRLQIQLRTTLSSGAVVEFTAPYRRQVEGRKAKEH